jgi:hypothetical protein
MAITSTDQRILVEAEEFLRSEVAPHAEMMDGDPEALKAALDGMCRRDLMALKRRPATCPGTDR